MKKAYLFVYGTLRRDSKNEMSRLLQEQAELVGDATYQGILYKVDYYPGVVPSESTTDIVHGEVYGLKDPESTLPRLDQYEECGPDCPEPTEYIRKIQQVRLRNSEPINAWTYLYNLPTDNLERIPSGSGLGRR